MGTNGREHSLSPRKCQLGRSFLPSLEFASEGHHRFIVRNYAPSFQLLHPMDPRILTLFCVDEGCQPRYVVTLTYLDQKEPNATLPSIWSSSSDALHFYHGLNVADPLQSLSSLKSIPMVLFLPSFPKRRALALELECASSLSPPLDGLLLP